MSAGSKPCQGFPDTKFRVFPTRKIGSSKDTCSEWLYDTDHMYGLPMIVRV